MKWILVMAGVVIVCSGCATVAEHTPSLKYCERVTYERIGAKMTIKAECTVPVGTGAL